MHLFYVLEMACRGQLLLEAAAASGLQKHLIDRKDAEFTGNLLQDSDVLWVLSCSTLEDANCGEL